MDASAFLEKRAGPISIAKVIRSTRQGEEISQQEFAATLGISKQHLCDIEAGRKGVSPARAWAWAVRLGFVPRQWAELALQDQLERDGLKGLRVRLESAS